MGSKDAVYVDALFKTPMSRNWHWPEACHMFVDPDTDLEVLHQFAESIGMRREWFQNQPGKMPHYDLNASRRRVALAHGAVVMDDRRDVVEVIHKWRLKFNMPEMVKIPGSQSLPRLTRVKSRRMRRGLIARKKMNRDGDAS